MAAVSSSPSSQSHPSADVHDLKIKIRQHEVAIEELNNLHSSRSVYVKKCNLLFRTSVQKATASEQGQLDVAKKKMQNLNKK